MLIEGKLIKGKGLAGQMGFPSLNIEYAGEVSGIFAGEIFLDEEWRKAAVHLGPRPTVGDPKPICEVYVLDWHGQLPSGSLLKIKILKKIREVQKFANLDELGARIAKDVEFVKMSGSF